MLHLLDHPLAAHLLTRLRDRTTAPADFRRYTQPLAVLLALAATRDLPTTPQPVTTPLETTTGQHLAQELVVVPVLRAGLVLVEPFLQLFPQVSVGHLGLERDHVTARPRSYYHKLPPLGGRTVLVLDPMLATGGSAGLALDAARAAGATDLRLVCIVCAPEGVAAVARAHPQVPIHAAALDRCLDARSYILPGLGDFGDRLYGTA